TWKAVDLKNRTLKFNQTKTKRITEGKLNQNAIALLGQAGKENELVFDLPTANGANKSLNLLVKRAGFDKKIRWHNLRHSFGTNLYDAGAEIYTVSKQLGHRGVTHTLRYARASDKRKQEAVYNLPEINFNSRVVENDNTFELVSFPNREAAKRLKKKPRKKKV
ncbi:MAG TPA: tyrosine-type recombinase/integrase, partial [Chitinophagaceae bacterium]